MDRQWNRIMRLFGRVSADFLAALSSTDLELIDAANYYLTGVLGPQGVPVLRSVVDAMKAGHIIDPRAQHIVVDWLGRFADSAEPDEQGYVIHSNADLLYLCDRLDLVLLGKDKEAWFRTLAGIENDEQVCGRDDAFIACLCYKITDILKTQPWAGVVGVNETWWKWEMLKELV